MKKQTITIVIVTILSLGVIGYNFYKELVSNIQPRKQGTIKKIERIPVHQTITSSSDNILIFDELTIENGKTALDLLKKTTMVKTKGEGVNAFVTSIDNRQADDSKKEFWAFYVNGKQAEVGAGSYVLKNNDKIEWKIETY